MRRRFSRSVLTLLFVGAALLPGRLLTAAELRFAGYPDVSADTVVFVYRDAIWTVPVAGGTAKLLSDVGDRPRNPKFSPDGKLVAYAATVDDNQDIYVASMSGGEIRRLTYHPARDDMVDWYPDGKSLLFKSPRSSPRAVYNRVFRIDASGGLAKLLPLPYAETAAISDDGSQILFTYLKDFQEEVWKRYLGGRAPDIWSFDTATGESRNLTDSPAPDSVPMFWNGKIFYLSEAGRARRSNIWRLDDSGAKQVTFLEHADIRHPSVGPAGVVYELEGKLFLMADDENAGEIEIEIDIARNERVEKLVSLAERIESASAGPSDKIVFEARGDVLVYDVETAGAINLSNSSDAAERFPSMSPDGKTVAYQSDADGEYQLYLRDVASGEIRKLTDFKTGFRYRPFWSPDSNYLAFMDQQQVIWIAGAQNGNLVQVDQGHWRYHWDMPRFRMSWSPDSQWLTYSRGGENRNQSVYVYSVRDKRLDRLTSGFYSDFGPVFDPSGNYIAMTSYRNFAPTFGDIDATFTYKGSMLVSLLPLIGSIGVPGDVGWRIPPPREKVTIEISGAESRLRSLPFPAGTYSALSFAEDGLSAMHVTEDGSELLHLDFSQNELETVWNGGRSQVLDAQTGRLLLRADENYLLIRNQAPVESVELEVDVLSAEVFPQKEFLQMFDDSWRYQRDFYYDPGMHGVDWAAIRDQYRPLAEQAHSEQELTAIIREMHAELAAGHVYVSAEPPYNRGPATNVGLLGVEFDVQDGAYRIERILRPGLRRAEHRSPLDDAIGGIEEGDFILTVNGRSLRGNRSPWAPFVGLADQVVTLEIADSASGKNSRNIRVRTLASERKLRELVWVEENRRHVDEASGGRIGYIYVPNTGAEGQNELMQMYRAQYHKDALIIDERFNTGGALGDRFVELLNRPPLNYFSSRNANHYPLPELAHRGPKAMLINSWSYSGGDGFPFLFKTAGVGPLVGTRTWGGLIGPGMRMSLINGGFISAPPQRVYDVNGNWAEGNEGVRPDVHVQNNPGRLAAGTDEQLQYAIALLLEQIESMPDVVVPAFPEHTPLEGAGD